MSENVQEPIRADDYIAPTVGRKAFHCMFCGVYAQQAWQRLDYAGRSDQTRVALCTCTNCRNESLWRTPRRTDVGTEDSDGIMLWPTHAAGAPAPHIDMPDDVQFDYEEARSIVDPSPRGAAALLRLALQKLMVDLGESGKDINSDIGSPVRKGLPVEVQQALDALRVIGNESVHPGTLDLRDDRDTAVSLFGLLNFIVEQRIAQPKKLQQLYSGLPPAKLAGIQQRDSQSKPP
jgi:hypothetical protein